MTCSIGMAVLAAISVFVALAAGMHTLLVRRGLRRDLEPGIDGDRDPEGLRRALAIKENNKSKEGRAPALGQHGG